MSNEVNNNPAESTSGHTPTPTDKMAEILFGATSVPAEGKQEPMTRAEGAEAEPTATMDLTDIGLDMEDPINQELAGMVENPEAAQKLHDLHLRANENAWDQLSEQWRGQVEQEFSADQLQDARDVFRMIADDELTEFLNSTGLGNHPALIRALVTAAVRMR